MLLEPVQRAQVRVNVLRQGLDQQAMILAFMAGRRHAKEPEVGRVAGHLRQGLGANTAVTGGKLDDLRGIGAQPARALERQ